MKRLIGSICYGIGHASFLACDRLFWRRDETEGIWYHVGLPFWWMYQTFIVWSWRIDPEEKNPPVQK